MNLNDLSGFRFLVVEDTADHRHLIETFLNRAGAAVESVEDGPEALELFEHRPQTEWSDVVLLDLQMPKMSGYEVARKLRELGFDGPLIAATASEMMTERYLALSAGFDHRLLKPFTEISMRRVCLAAAASVNAAR